MEPTGGLHGQIAIQVASRIAAHVSAARSGAVFGTDTGFRLERDPDTVLAPDVAYVSYERLPREAITDRYPEVAPDLAVEVRSPGDTWKAPDRKARAWISFGARVVWVIDPGSRTAAVHRADAPVERIRADGFLSAEPAIPAFALRLGDLLNP